ncbi:hypothetical protein AK812_SmicGene6126 [Symbiodinium microadriaticum]|uniref:Uncharacterized protein n=1 Tax=Symbiodinium microadriaticum TaxID=2951 RepID=A0A1Q9ERY9_SYMMI|nr:hypothetical protein AK812_SmicGene6126 [Symbiodinium microadriaticum]
MLMIMTYHIIISIIIIIIIIIIMIITIIVIIIIITIIMTITITVTVTITSIIMINLIFIRIFILILILTTVTSVTTTAACAFFTLSSVRFPGVWALGEGNFYEFTHSDRPAVLVALGPEVGEDLEQEIRGAQREFSQEFLFGALNGSHWSEERHEMPRAIRVQCDSLRCKPGLPVTRLFRPLGPAIELGSGYPLFCCKAAAAL